MHQEAEDSTRQNPGHRTRAFSSGDPGSFARVSPSRLHGVDWGTQRPRRTMKTLEIELPDALAAKLQELVNGRLAWS